MFQPFKVILKIGDIGPLSSLICTTRLVRCDKKINVAHGLNVLLFFTKFLPNLVALLRFSFPRVSYRTKSNQKKIQLRSAIEHNWTSIFCVSSIIELNKPNEWNKIDRNRTKSNRLNRIKSNKIDSNLFSPPFHPVLEEPKWWDQRFLKIMIP